MEQLYVKIEPSPLKSEPSCSVCVKDEHPCVKSEPVEPSEGEGAYGVIETAAALYADHIVKDELVLGPALVQPRRELRTAPGQKQQEENEKPYTADKPYICAQCGYATACLSDLSIHVRIHNRKEPYKWAYLVNPLSK